MRAQARLIDRLCTDLAPGRLEWIGLRSAHRGEIAEVDEVQALAGLGLEGDHRSLKTPGSGRQVTLISREFIQQIELYLQRPVNPVLLRRNLLVSGINLNVLRYQQVRIGEVVLEANSLCQPCSRMETALGKGAVAAMLGFGGLCAKVIHGGLLRVGDTVTKC